MTGSLRGAENRALQLSKARCREQGITTIKGYYYPTAKNNMVKDLYGRFGFDKISEDEQGNTIWQLDVADYENKCHVIKVEDNSSIQS